MVSGLKSTTYEDRLSELGLTGRKKASGRYGTDIQNCDWKGLSEERNMVQIGDGDGQAHTQCCRLAESEASGLEAGNQEKFLLPTSDRGLEQCPSRTETGKECEVF